MPAEEALDSASSVRAGKPSPAKESFLKLQAGAVPGLILFVFGGGLLALYYAGIGYFPEVTWQDALTSMALMTIIGGSLLMAYGFLLFVPGAIWSEFLIRDPQLRPLFQMDARSWESCVWGVTTRILVPFAWFMAFCHALFFLPIQEKPIFVVLGAAASLAAVAGLLGRVIRYGLESHIPKKEKTTAWKAFPPHLLRHYLHVGLFHTPLLFAAVAYGFEKQALRIPAALLWSSALLPFASVLAFLGFRRAEHRRAGVKEIHPPPANGKEDRQWGQKPGHRGAHADHWGLLCRSVLAFVCAALLGLVALWYFYRIYRGQGAPGSEEVPPSLLLLCTLIVVLANLAVSVLFHDRRRLALLVSFLSALVLLGAGQLLGTDAEDRLPAKIMQKFGFGEKSATLVLTEKGGRLLCQLGIAVEFEEEALEASAPGPDQNEADRVSGSSNSKPKDRRGPEGGRLARAGGLTILSRLGSEFVLHHEKPEQTLVLPKEEVVSWSVGRQPPIVDRCRESRGTDASPTATAAEGPDPRRPAPPPPPR
jgi:hypothetical protein